MSWDRPILLGEESYGFKQAFPIYTCNTVPHVSGQTNAAGLGIIRQYFMNAPQYVLVKVQLMIWLQTRISYIHLQPVHGCAMPLASKKLLDKREKGLLTSQFEQLGRFCDMSASRLPEYTSLA